MDLIRNKTDDYGVSALFYLSLFGSCLVEFGFSSRRLVRGGERQWGLVF